MIDIIIYSIAILLSICCTIGFIHKKRLNENIYIDELTKMYNRKIMPSIKNKDKKIKFCVISADIDHFKNVNDTYGHSVGDTVLKTVASVLLESFKSDTDYVVRFGGEEFIVFVEIKEDSSFIEKRTNQIREKIEKLEILTNDMQLVKITTSFGISSELKLTLNKRIENSDKNLYKAKTTGRNKVVMT